MTAAPGWTVDDFQGAFARITRGGSLVINETPVSKNDADHVFIDNDDVVPFLMAGDTLEIVIPGAKMDGPGPDLGLFAIMGSGSAFDGFLGTFGLHAFTRIELDSPLVGNVGGLTFDRCLFAGITALFRGGSQGFASCASTTVLNLDNPAQHASVDPSGIFIIPTAGRTSLIVTAGGSFTMRGGQASFGRNVSVWDRPFGNGITLEETAFLDLQAGGTLAVQGINGSGVGIFCAQNTTVIVEGGTLTTITGPIGDIQLDYGGAISYGTGAGEFEEAAGFDGIFTRVQENAGSAASPRADSSIIRTL